MTMTAAGKTRPLPTGDALDKEIERLSAGLFSGTDDECMSLCDALNELWTELPVTDPGSPDYKEIVAEIKAIQAQRKALRCSRCLQT